jgi:hypothetical protein
MSEFDKKISALTSGTDSTATDEYVIARGGSNFKISGALVAAAATKVGTLASLAVTGNVSLGADVVLSRGAADRLDLASGDSLNIVSGTVKIAGTDVLGATTLGSGVTASSLTSVGTLSALTVTGDLTVDTSTLKVDAANNRVGIGTATPAALLDLNAGSGSNTNIAISQANSVKWFIGNVDTTNAFRFFDNTALVERARIPAAGGFQCVNSISVGNATPTTSGAGITFPATQSASSDANTLDDYEEGTWTPTYNNLTIGNATVVSTYTKIGRVVTVTVNVTWGSTTSASGEWRITGLPFVAATPGGGSAYALDAGTENYILAATVSPSTFGDSVAISDGTGGGQVSNTAPFTWTTSDRFSCAATYFV